MWTRLGLAAGLVAPPLFVAATVAVTLVDRGFVADTEWSAVHRSEVGWPSVVLLGPHGGWAIAALATCGALTVAFAAALWRIVAGAPLLRAAAILLAGVGISLALVAVPQDPLDYDGPASWQDRLHDAAYPPIPIGATLAAALVWAGARRRPGWAPMARISLAAVIVAAPAFALTAVDDVAQLARFPLFGSLLVWTEALALTAARQVRREG